MKSVYLASPFFSPAQKERIAQVKAALEKNPTIDEKAIFVPHENEYTKAEFGSLEWQKAAFQLDTSQIDARHTEHSLLILIKPDIGTGWRQRARDYLDRLDGKVLLINFIKTGI